MDDSSDDKESSLRYSLDKALVTVTRVDPTLHTTDSRDPSPLTITRTDPTPGTYRTEPTLAPIQHSVAGSGTSSCEDNGCDVVEDLNVDLEKLTLRTTSSIERHPVEKKSAGNFQPYDNVPKRKSSVYHQFFDPCKLDGGRDTSVRRSTNSLRVRKYTRSNQSTKCNKLLSRPSRKLAEPLISDSETFSNNFCRAESEDYLASLSAGSGQLDMDNVRPFSPTPIGHQVSTEKNDEISTIYSSDDGGRVKSAPAVMAQTEKTCNVSPTIPQRGSFMFDSAQCNGTDDSHARIDFISGTTESSVELLSLNICETTVVSEIEDVNPVESRATHRTVTRYTEPDETVKPPHDEDLTEPSGPSYVSIAGVDIPMAESDRVPWIIERQQSHRVLESMLPGKPSKSEASLESCRTTYAIMGARSFQLQTPTFCPSNHEILGDVALANVERGRSNDCEISPRSRSVERAMSSEEDSSDSECARDQIDCEDNVQVVVPPRPSPPSRSTSPPPLLSPIRPHQPPQTEAASSHPCNQNVISAFAFQEPPPPPYRDRTENRVAEESVENRKHRLKKTERLRRSLSEGDNSACRESFRCRCSCGCSAAQSRILDVPGGTGDTLEACEHQLNLGAFPNLPDARLIELGLSDPPYGHELCDRISEDELERKYTALSIGLGTDRATLPRRLALSLRQRDQAERNLATEVGRMQRDIQDNARQQRVSISGRMTLRRPSLSYDTQRWDEKLDRTDSSSSSVGELREIFEQAESRRGSKEENNNLIRRQLNNFSVAGCESGDSDTFISTRGDSTIFQTQVRDEELLTENTSPRRRVPPVYGMLRDQVSRLPVFWYILFVAVFFFGFYSNRYVTTRYMAPLKWWSIEEIFQRYGYFRRNPPPPV